MLPRDSWLLQGEQTPNIIQRGSASVSVDTTWHTRYERFATIMDCGITSVNGTGEEQLPTDSMTSCVSRAFYTDIVFLITTQTETSINTLSLGIHHTLAKLPCKQFLI